MPPHQTVIKNHGNYNSTFSKSQVLDILRKINHKVVAYNPIYAKILGSVSSAVIMSQLMYIWSCIGKEEFFHKDEDLAKETGATKWEIITTKRKLKELGLFTIEQKEINKENKWYRVSFYKLNIDKYIELLSSVDNNEDNGGNDEDGPTNPNQNNNTSKEKTVDNSNNDDFVIEQKTVDNSNVDFKSCGKTVDNLWITCGQNQKLLNPGFRISNTRSLEFQKPIIELKKELNNIYNNKSVDNSINENKQTNYDSIYKETLIYVNDPTKCKFCSSKFEKTDNKIEINYNTFAHKTCYLLYLNEKLQNKTKLCYN